MAWTANDLAAIERAIATGRFVVQYGDKKVQYRTMEELLLARDTISKAIEAEADPTIKAKQARIVTGSGW